MDSGAGCTSECWREEEEERGKGVVKMTEAGQRGESVENTKRASGGKGVGGEDDRRRPKRFGQVNESKKEYIKGEAWHQKPVKKAMQRVRREIMRGRKYMFEQQGEKEHM